MSVTKGTSKPVFIVQRLDDGEWVDTDLGDNTLHGAIEWIKEAQKLYPDLNFRVVPARTIPTTTTRRKLLVLA